ncbi:unnamed protein product, partial [Gadus morhua 'NCC']
MWRRKQLALAVRSGGGGWRKGGGGVLLGRRRYHRVCTLSLFHFLPLSLSFSLSSLSLFPLLFRVSGLRRWMSLRVHPRKGLLALYPNFSLSIMEQFNPCLRNFIAMGKSYEKALS